MGYPVMVTTADGGSAQGKLTAVHCCAVMIPPRWHVDGRPVERAASPRQSICNRLPNPSGPPNGQRCLSIEALVASSCCSAHSPRLFTGGLPPSARPLSPRRPLEVSCKAHPVNQTIGQPPGTRLCVAVGLEPFSFLFSSRQEGLQRLLVQSCCCLAKALCGPWDGSARHAPRSSLRT